ncbi:unnamed protein product [Prorocentrum cordatum]|nr:unnamed protein product [Polarella glacialis]
MWSASTRAWHRAALHGMAAGKQFPPSSAGTRWGTAPHRAVAGSRYRVRTRGDGTEGEGEGEGRSEGGGRGRREEGGGTGRKNGSARGPTGRDSRLGTFGARSRAALCGGAV